MDQNMLLFLVIAVPLLAFALFICWPAPDERYIGYGWKLEWLDGVVYVRSRHLNTPAGRAGVIIESVMLSYDGHPMEFATKEEFLEAINRFGRPKEVGHESTFRLRHQEKEYEVTLKAEVIHGPIRYNHIPNEAEMEAMQRDPNVVVGMLDCLETGQLVPTVRLSEEAVDAVLERH